MRIYSVLLELQNVKHMEKSSLNINVSSVAKWRVGFAGGLRISVMIVMHDNAKEIM